ncbi:3-phosphoshikimate 1-carboxyvinyltransferase [Candidatus Peregrinibacteria bacterium CG11_big_fil_rev_8_21_14_0_20_41_10]|nr:MAG: 3-phosphoshikimate 1-carboxyvinyltransferase [Candidatus Peregrinibacteria bacterium CG11_big_fil_rev_8_21_14_0_20_41_10]PIZ76347.1 MAG: 3-phosphoshikimate 1-carboxyvinyltransferase [Candidatus Peregrinibacteria bacterium CG_4_10_14_0_2_um_filter_41_8]PJC37626.1 MAG: 3-phosphoshikimate 1-carboxyvinyltransferase [Candidatus Peregrinibacteria bacterium CG_4_9_14_0_2_um_filter_41_14]
MINLYLLKFGNNFMREIIIPPSKSLSNRALLIGLYEPFYLKNVLKSDDTKVMLEVLQKLGVDVEVTVENEYAFDVKMKPGQFKDAGDIVELYVENAGTAARFLTVALSFLPGKYRLYGNKRMHERPIKPLIEALEQLGANIEYETEEGYLPLLITGKKLATDVERTCIVDQQISSQYLSGVLLNALFWSGKTIVARSGNMISESYVDLTLGMLMDLGFEVQVDHAKNYFMIEGQQKLVKPEYIVEPDFSSASYWIARTAVTGEEFLLKDLHLNSLQGDRLFLEVMEKAGVKVEDLEQGIVVAGTGHLQLPELIDCTNFPDAAMTLAITAAVSNQKMKLTGIGSLRVKECDRIEALVTELQKVGVKAVAGVDSLTVFGVETDLLIAAEIDTYNDHRMAMCFAIVQLLQPNLVITNPSCVSKTYPTFWDDWGFVDRRG